MISFFNLLVEINIDFGRFLQSFDYMWKGLLGIFIVIAVLIVGILLLNKLTSRGDKNGKDEENKD